MKRFVKLSDVWAMLDACAPGHEKQLGHGCHNYQIFYLGRTATLPKGPHGKKPGQGEVRTGKVRNLLRRLEILECGSAFLDI